MLILISGVGHPHWATAAPRTSVFRRLPSGKVADVKLVHPMNKVPLPTNI